MTEALSAYKPYKVPHSVLQSGLAPIVLGAALVWINALTSEGFMATAFLAVLVLGGALVLITWTASRLQDEGIQNLGYVFFLKYLTIFPLLQLGWIPQLDPLSSSFGYDPQRYYFDAARLASSNFDISALALNLNYTGVIFYYAAVFRTFGVNPIVPALLNTFVTLGAALVVLYVGYQIRQTRQRLDWTLGLYFVLPEVVWFDLLTSRETLAMSLIVLAVLPIGLCAARDRPRPSAIITAALTSLAAVAALSVVRTSMLLPVMVSIVTLIASGGSARNHRIAILSAVVPVAIVVAIGPTLAERLGGYQWGYVEWLQSARSAEYLEQISPGWSSQSIGQRLIPRHIGQEIPFGIVRMAAYLLAPLPNVQTTITGLRTGSWADWQSLMSTTSAITNLCVFPMAVASLVDFLRRRSNGAARVFHVTFWCTFAAIGIANLTINERYRLMIVPLLWGCAWLGREALPVTIVRAYFACFLLAAFGVLFFAAVKF